MKERVKFGVLFMTLLALVVGAVVFSYGIYYTVNARKEIGSYNEMTAVVVGYEEIKSFSPSDNRTRITYAEVVEYSVDGVTYRAQNTASSSSPKDKGATMRIAVNPADPADCIFVNSQKWMCVFLIVFGAVLIAFGIAMAVYLAKNLRR